MNRALKMLSEKHTEIILTMNVVSLILGITYLLIGKMNILWNCYGFLMLVTYIINILFTAARQKQVKLCCLYLILSAVWMFAVMLINTVVSLSPDQINSQSPISVVMLLSLFFLGGIITYNKMTDLKRKSADAAQITGKNLKKSGIVAKNILIIILSAILWGGLFLAINLLRVNKNGLIEVFLPEYSLFYAIAFLSIGALIIKLLNKEKYKLYYFIVLVFTIFMFFVFLIPIASVPSLIRNANYCYQAAFLSGNKKSDAFSSDYFRKMPFFLPEYFFGTPSGDFSVHKNILYYEGTEGVNKGLKLYFDAYMPNDETGRLPGKNSVLLRIHGGGWTSGDKGAGNFAQMNKYFAAQGYVVFDIQYGLKDLITWLNVLPVPESTSGDYSINDMVRHIGLFTDYLSDHAEEYHANLDSVFISGGSAGGQLCLAAGLSPTGNSDTKVLNSKLKIKGLIPFYPANGLSLVFDIGGEPALVDPTLLISKNSPPCLMYQGSHDGLVSYQIADKFRAAYIAAGNDRCALLSMPFGGHASDFYFSGYYNQVFLYYMERFMYQFQ